MTMRPFDEQPRTTTMKRPRSPMRPARLALYAAIGFGVGLSAVAQSSKSKLPSAVVDQGVVFPPSQPLPSVRQDAAALTIIHAYQKAVGNASWSDMEATGEMVPAALHLMGTSVLQSATLWISGHTAYRLDVQTPTGTISIRIDGANGAMRPPGNRILPMDSRDAVVGLVAFPQIEDSGFPDSKTSLIDQGTVQVDGIALQRITAEVPWMAIDVKGQQQSDNSITDLYFDPATSLLVKSANALRGADPRLARYMKVVTYGDYRQVNGVKIPFQLNEALNGQCVWTLQLNHVQLNRGTAKINFHF